MVLEVLMLEAFMLEAVMVIMAVVVLQALMLEAVMFVDAMLLEAPVPFKAAMTAKGAATSETAAMSAETAATVFICGVAPGRRVVGICSCCGCAGVRNRCGSDRRSDGKCAGGESETCELE